MNFQDLLAKMKQIDEAPTSECGDMPVLGKEPQGDMLAGECGGMMTPNAPVAPKQADNVTISVNMNGQGAGGIADLMKILRNIEDAGTSSHDADDVLVGMDADESFANEPNAQVAGVDAVTPTGDDMHSKGAEAEKVNGGGNPMGVDESLVSRLSNLYNEIKEGYNPNSSSAENRRKLDKSEHDRLKAAAEKDGASDAEKARYKRYKDRKAATASAYDAETER